MKQWKRVTPLSVEIEESLIAHQLAINERKIIISPGKFEGESYYAPYLYDCSLDNWDYLATTDNNGSYVYLSLDAEEKAVFDTEFDMVEIRETSDGFIRIAFCTENYAIRQCDEINQLEAQSNE